MKDQIFSLQEANRVLPLVKSITRDAVRRYRDVKQAIRALELLKSGGSENSSALDRQDRIVEGHLDDLRRLIDELESLGCRLRDYERGVVDFPAATLDGDQFVYYCWILGEEVISHWHREEEGFEERRLLEAEASA